MRSFWLHGMFGQPSSFCCMSSDYTISRQWRETSSSQPAEGGLIPYGRHNQRQSLVSFGFISAHVAQHPQVILGRALGHQCRHPPRLNHEQLLRQAQARHPPMVGMPDFGRVAGPLPSSVVDDTVPGTNTISCWGSRSSELPLHSWLLRSVSPGFVCGHHHRIWW